MIVSSFPHFMNGFSRIPQRVTDLLPAWYYNFRVTMVTWGDPPLSCCDGSTVSFVTGAPHQVTHSSQVLCPHELTSVSVRQLLKLLTSPRWIIPTGRCTCAGTTAICSPTCRTLACCTGRWRRRARRAPGGATPSTWVQLLITDNKYIQLNIQRKE